MLKSDKSSHLNACHELAWIVRDFNRRRKQRNPRDLHRKIGDFYGSHGLGLLEGFAKLQDVKFIFPADALSQIRPQMVGKKAALYSGCSLCILPSLFHLGRPRLDSAEFFCDFIEANSALVSRGRLIPFPMIDSRASYGSHTWGWWKLAEMQAIKKKIDDNRVNSYAEKSDALPVFGHQQSLVSQLNEDIADTRYVPAGTQQLLLPTLDGLDQETLLSVLEDNDNPSIKFRNVLHGVLKGVSANDSDRKLLEAMERVDSEVRNLDDKMRTINRDRIRAGMETTVGLVATGLSLVVPDWISQSASAALGSVTALDGYRALNKLSNEANLVKTNDFYLPWLIHAKSDG